MSIKRFMITAAIVAVLGGSVGGCGLPITMTNVPAGHVGVLVERYGDDKGVQQTVKAPGRYWLNWNEELFLFPTFTQNYCWTKANDPQCGSPNDESMTFQDRDGMVLNADIGITYSIETAKVATVFQKYRRGVQEITDVYLRNMVRDAMSNYAASMTADELYGRGKEKFMNAVEKDVATKVEAIGIKIEGIYIIGEVRLPLSVISALNAKIEAIQKTAQRENEVAQSTAEAKKKVEEAKGEAESVRIRAESQANANRILAASITPTLVMYRAIEKWNGAVPHYFGGSTGTLLQLPVEQPSK